MKRGYAIFDTAIGRCGIAWSDVGVVAVQLPEAREIETRGRLFRSFPEAREERPSPNTESAIEGIVAVLRGDDTDFSDVNLDMSGIPPFNQRVYDAVRSIPRGETRSQDHIAALLQLPKTTHAVAQALSKNPFMIIVPCHRVLDAGNGQDKPSPNTGTISKRRLQLLEGSRPRAGLTLFDALLAVDRPRAAH
jgi:methylated-DNA-[protein]-cysteine S-methyltransferase